MPASSRAAAPRPRPRRRALVRLLPALATGVLAALYRPQAAAAQVELAGELDVAYAQDVRQKSGEARSQINTSFKGKSPFSLIRFRLQADAPVADGIAATSILRYDEGRGEAEIEGAYVVFSSLLGRPRLNVLVGKMAMAFGTFASRGHATRNAVIGVPLIYQYFTAAQGGRVPGGPAEQLSYRDAAVRPGRGMPIVYDACWNTGVEVFGTASRLDYALALTKGTVSNPGSWDNEGAQLVTHFGFRPSMGWKLGVSTAVGSYLSAGAADAPAFPAGKSVEEFYQVIYGADAQYVFGHWEVAAEAVRASWEVPNLGDLLTLRGGYLEGSRALRPGLRVAARLGLIDFAAVADGRGGRTDWDYDVGRLETAVEHYVSRNARIKLALQLNYRPDAPDDEDHLVGAQVATAF
ncbi:MAG: hypothetical protein ABIL09_06635 [Gemmatimonadota bacterium]